MKSRFPFLFECKWLATYAVDRSSHKDTRRNDKELLLQTSLLLCECFFLFSFFLVLIIHSGNGVVVDVRAYIQNGRSISPVNLRFPFIIHMWWCTVARPIYCQPACCFGPTCEHNDLVALHGLSLSPPSEKKKLLPWGLFNHLLLLCGSRWFHYYYFVIISFVVRYILSRRGSWESSLPDGPTPFHHQYVHTNKY